MDRGESLKTFDELSGGGKHGVVQGAGCREGGGGEGEKESKLSDSKKEKSRDTEKKKTRARKPKKFASSALGLGVMDVPLF